MEESGAEVWGSEWYAICATGRTLRALLSSALRAVLCASRYATLYSRGRAGRAPFATDTRVMRYVLNEL